MEMVAALAEATRGIDLHVVGGSDAELAAWRSRVGEPVGRGSRVWFHGFVPHGDLAWYYQRCDAFLAPYRASVEGVERGKDLSRWMSPLKIFEYMAAGRPILCSSLPVLREVLQHGVNALLLPPDDVGAWRDALYQLHEDAELRYALGARARADLLARFTWKARAERVLGAFRERSARRAGAPA